MSTSHTQPSLTEPGTFELSPEKEKKLYAKLYDQFARERVNWYNDIITKIILTPESRRLYKEFEKRNGSARSWDRDLYTSSGEWMEAAKKNALFVVSLAQPPTPAGDPKATRLPSLTASEKEIKQMTPEQRNQLSVAMNINTTLDAAEKPLGGKMKFAMMKEKERLRLNAVNTSGKSSSSCVI